MGGISSLFFSFFVNHFYGISGPIYGYLSRVWKIKKHPDLGKELQFKVPCWHTGLGRFQLEIGNAGCGVIVGN
jgi:hypothetical protein